MTRRAKALVGVTGSLVTLLAILGVQAVGAADGTAVTDTQIAREQLALAAKALETISELESSGQVSPGMREVPR